MLEMRWQGGCAGALARRQPGQARGRCGTLAPPATLIFHISAACLSCTSCPAQSCSAHDQAPTVMCLALLRGMGFF